MKRHCFQVSLTVKGSRDERNLVGCYSFSCKGKKRQIKKDLTLRGLYKAKLLVWQEDRHV